MKPLLRASNINRGKSCYAFHAPIAAAQEMKMSSPMADHPTAFVLPIHNNWTMTNGQTISLAEKIRAVCHGNVGAIPLVVANGSESSTTRYAGYLRSKDNTGFVDSILAQQPIATASTGFKDTGRIDDGPFAGATWQITPELALSSAFYYDHMRNATTANGTLGSGSRYTAVALAEYALSKRTEVYGTVDFNKVNGAATVELPGRSNQTGVSIGFRNLF
jgi:hypothetical protein